MARILPEQPMGRVSPARGRVHRLVESLPDGYVAWSPVGEGPTPLPDFWIVEEATLRTLVLLVAETTEDQAKGPGLFGEAAEWRDPAVTESVRVKAAREALGSRAVRGVVLFPDVPKDLLPERIDGWPRAGRETCRPAVFGTWIAAQMSDPMDPETLQSVRARFSPESMLLARHVMRREGASSEAPRFLTWKQEEILKSDLDPGAEGRTSAGDFGLLVVQGVAGSGKSLVLLHRALLLSRLHPGSRVLVLTCNKPLQVELQRRFAELSEAAARVEFSTFHAFCLRRWPGEGRPAILDGFRRRTLLDQTLAGLERPLLLRKQLEEEFAWIFDHGFADEEAYAKTPRRGRGFRMDAALRERMWTASRTFRAACLAEGASDWSLLPLLFRERVAEAEVARYDAILVDEAQFFAPVWFEAVKPFLVPQGHLFLAADPTQGFLRRGSSWKSLGLSVHGRSRRLERSHRSTRPIMDVAWKLWLARRGEDPEDSVEPRLEGMQEGPVPALYRFPDARSETAWIEEQVGAFLDGGGAAGDVLVLHEDWKGSRSLLESLASRLGPERVADAKEPGRGAEVVRVCSLNAATGLESPVVFVAGFDRIFDREGSPDLVGDERLQARDEATRKAYMALTRAGWRLVATTSGDLPPEVAAAFG